MSYSEIWAAAGTPNSVFKLSPEDLGCYLFQQGILSPSERHTLLFKQGDLLNAPSNIYVHLTTKDRKTRE